ncbi:MAG: putative RNA-binding protein, contains TRAM domain protein [Haloquadratum sp. J07HQX50]|jgi:Predicted RNA-binding protein, contains TRAM domain|nr:MAG: putative RNA-binding protein, contains TRAM domain protein [Haloquadratum sp. J07HQX50]
MNISERLQCLFSATIEENDDTYTITVPDTELDIGSLETAESYQVALLAESIEGQSAGMSTEQISSESSNGTPTAPVEVGEQRNVEIEDLGEQGDGITRVERGFVVIVPDTELGERVSVKIESVRDSVAFASVVERLSYYD